MIVISPETRMMGLPCGEEIMIVGRTMWTQSTSVTDRRTDRRTDRITVTDTVQTASHGKNHDLILNIKKNSKNYKSSLFTLPLELSLLFHQPHFPDNSPPPAPYVISFLSPSPVLLSITPSLFHSNLKTHLPVP